MMEPAGPSKPTNARRRRSLMDVVISIDIGHSIFCALWWLLLCFLMINTAFLSVVGYSYLTYFDRVSELRNIARDFLFSKQIQFLEQNHAVIGMAYAVMASPFAVFAARMIWYTIKRRHLAFGPAHAPPTSKRDSPRGQRRPRTVFASLQRLLARYSIGGAKFTTFIMVSETAEVFMQFCQSFQASKTISNPILSQIYGTMILINCCSTPLIIHWCEKTRQGAKTENVLCAVTNSFLAFTWGTVVQGMLFHQYLSYDKAMHWSNLVPETYERGLGYILVVSPMNFVFSTFTFITSGVVMLDCVRALNNNGLPLESFISSKSSRVKSSRRSVSVMPAGFILPTIQQATSLSSFLRWWYVFMIWFGGCVFVVSMGATGKIWSLKDSTVPCLDQIYPWFASEITCVGRKINCTQLHISGNMTELDAVFHTFGTYLLSSLAIVNCPALEMPPSIQGFNQLETLTVINATVLRWDTTAAIDNEHFPELKTLSLHVIEFVTAPTGFVLQPLPASFEWLYAENINADTFIDMVGDNWSMMVYFYCRACNLRRIPAMVYNTSKLRSARLENNSIQLVEDSMFADKVEFSFLSLNHNPVADLPASVWRLLSQLWWLEVEHTNMSSIPAVGIAAAASNDILVIRAAGTPLCAKNATQSLPPAKLDCSAYSKGW